MPLVQAVIWLYVMAGRSSIQRLYDGGTATWFRASSRPLQARKTWIDGGLTPKGAIMVDDGASLALSRGKSLLAAGITGVTGSFDKGDLVAITNPAEVTIARGPDPV